MFSLLQFKVSSLIQGRFKISSRENFTFFVFLSIIFSSFVLFCTCKGTWIRYFYQIVFVLFVKNYSYNLISLNTGPWGFKNRALENKFCLFVLVNALKDNELRSWNRNFENYKTTKFERSKCLYHFIFRPFNNSTISTSFFFLSTFFHMTNKNCFSSGIISGYGFISV